MSAKKIKHISFKKNQVPYFFTEESGFLEPDDNEQTYQITQKEIVKSVDITSAAKNFQLNLPHLGPYKIDYFRNGRKLLMGGRNGHVAVFDWITKELCCEFNVRESVHSVHWLQLSTMYAVAQADWTYVYDENGTQIHCLKRLYHTYELDFLPYHFLLVSVSENGFITWLDTSTGNLVANYRMKSSPRVTALTHNPCNAISITGHPNGSVKMWSPNVNEPLVQLLCHPTAIRDVVVDKRGLFMATSGADRSVRLWDVRNFKCLQNFKVKSMPAKMSLSQKNLLAISSGNVVEIYKDFGQQIDKPYMRHRLDDTNSIISSVQFCPFEDVLGIGHQNGFTSILVPGSGEANFDSLEANPYMTKSQLREMEVKALLEKVNHEMIQLDPDFIAKIESKQRAPNKYRDTMRAVEKRSRKKGKKSTAATSGVVEVDDSRPLDDDDDNQADSTENKKKPTVSLENYRPGKRGKKKLSTKLKSKAAKQEQLRRRAVKQIVMKSKSQKSLNKSE